MAEAAASDDFLEKYEDSFECSVCLALFINPRNLPCGHALCGPPNNCLTSLLEDSNTNKCPVCRRRFHLDDKHLDHFPVNYPLITAIETLKRKNEQAFIKNGVRKEEEETRSGICEQHKLEREFYCRSCSTCICKSCFADHGESPHTVTLFKYFIQESIATCQKQANEDGHFNKEKVETIEENCQKMLITFKAMEESIQLFRDEQMGIKLLEGKVMESTSELELELILSHYRESLSKANDSFNALKVSSEELTKVNTGFWSDLNLENQNEAIHNTAEVKTTTNVDEVLTSSSCFLDIPQSISEDPISEPVPNIEFGIRASNVTTKRRTSRRKSSVTELRAKITSIVDFVVNSACIGYSKAVVDSDKNVFVLQDSFVILKITINSEICNDNGENAINNRIDRITNVETVKYNNGAFTISDIAVSKNILYGLKWNLNNSQQMCLCTIDKTKMTIEDGSVIDTSVIRLTGGITNSTKDALIAGNESNLFLLVKNTSELFIFENKCVKNVVSLKCAPSTILQFTQPQNQYQLHAACDHLWLECEQENKENAFCVIGCNELKCKPLLSKIRRVSRLTEQDIKLEWNYGVTVRPFSSSFCMHGIKSRMRFSANGKREFTIYPNILKNIPAKSNQTAITSSLPSTSSSSCQQQQQQLLICDRDNCVVPKDVYFSVLCNLTKNKLLCCEYNNSPGPTLNCLYLLTISEI